MAYLSQNHCMETLEFTMDADRYRAAYSKLLGPDAADQVALEHAEMREKEYAVEVIDFVAERAGQQIFAANFERLTHRVEGLHGDELRAYDIAAKSGNGEAAFFFALFTFEVNDLGIRQHDLGFGIFATGYVDHRQAQIQSDLRRREPHAGSRVHGGEHVFGKLLELRIEVF